MSDRCIIKDVASATDVNLLFIPSSMLWTTLKKVIVEKRKIMKKLARLNQMRNLILIFIIFEID